MEQNGFDDRFGKHAITLFLITELTFQLNLGTHIKYEEKEADELLLLINGMHEQFADEMCPIFTLKLPFPVSFVECEAQHLFER